jgi:CRP/FNR family transcriptional regulator, cyclic AMP receptor protein
MLKKICKPGEVIFREGDESTEAYWITSGRVEITIRSGGAGLQVARLGPGEIVGEMGLIDDKPRSATATALGHTELEVITEEGFDKDVLQQPARLRTYLGTLFERLRGTVALLEVERARHPASAAPVAAPAAPSRSSVECGPEPVVRMTSALPNPVTNEIIKADVDRFPFRIGRAGDKWSAFFQNELAIADQNPLQVSRQHASIDHCGGGKCFVTDRGSRKGTTVNGVHIGVGAGALVAELKTGDNTVIFGHSGTSKHHYTINVSAGR